MQRRAHLAVGLIAPLAVMAANLKPPWGYTIDDAWISLRYARNLARGVGLVYNPGERVEGYTTLAWTVYEGAAARLGLDPLQVAKATGALCALASVVALYFLAQRLRPLGAAPCVATWLAATSVTLSMHAVLGLETVAFAAALLGGMLLLLEERDRPERFPWSGLALGGAALIRPEAPLFAAVFMISLGRAAVGRRNLIRATLVLLPAAGHVAFSRIYYGAWVPSSLPLRAAPFAQQLLHGADYFGGWLRWSWPVVALAAGGAWLGRRSPEIRACAAAALTGTIYILVIAHDWMLGWRHLSFVEPFVFLLADLAVRELADRPARWVLPSLALLAIAIGAERAWLLRAGQRQLILGDRKSWEQSAGEFSRIYLSSGHPGTIAIGDIGYVGWATDAPIYDFYGLVTPQRSSIGLREAKPAWLVYVSSGDDCNEPLDPIPRTLLADPELRATYALRRQLPKIPGYQWCVLERTR